MCVLLLSHVCEYGWVWVCVCAVVVVVRRCCVF